MENLLSKKELEKLPTPRLLKYFRIKRGLRYLFMCDCWGEKQFSCEEDERKSEEAIKYVAMVKSILDKREHLEEKWFEFRRIIYGWGWGIRS